VGSVDAGPRLRVAGPGRRGRDHGDTSVTDGILLCWYHHDHIHRRDITVHRTQARWVFTDVHGHTITPERDSAPA